MTYPVMIRVLCLLCMCVDMYVYVHLYEQGSVLQRELSKQWKNTSHLHFIYLITSLCYI